MKKYIKSILLITGFLFICDGAFAQQKQTDLSGIYYIQVAGKRGTGYDLHHGAGNVPVLLDHSNVDAWHIKKVGMDDRPNVQAPLYTISQDGDDKSYLSVVNGQPVCGTHQGQWHVRVDSHGISITWFEDETKGANALSVAATEPEKLNGGHLVYKVTLRRHNAGGNGMDDQIWKLVKAQ